MVNDLYSFEWTNQKLDRTPLYFNALRLRRTHETRSRVARDLTANYAIDALIRSGRPSPDPERAEAAVGCVTPLIASLSE